MHWDEGLPIELIGDDAAFAAWLVEHALPAHDLAGGLRAVRLLRGHVRAITEALAAGRPPLAADLAALEAALAAPMGHLALAGPDTLRPGWRSGPMRQTSTCSPSRWRCRWRRSSGPAIDAA